MNVVLTRASLLEFGAYEQAGAIVVGVRFGSEAPIQTVILQIADPASDLQKYHDGMYVELDDKAFYGGVTKFEYDSNEGTVHLILDPAKAGGVEDLLVELPKERSVADARILEKLWSVYSLGRE